MCVTPCFWLRSLLKPEVWCGLRCLNRLYLTPLGMFFLSPSICTAVLRFTPWSVSIDGVDTFPYVRSALHTRCQLLVRSCSEIQKVTFSIKHSKSTFPNQETRTRQLLFPGVNSSLPFRDEALWILQLHKPYWLPWTDSGQTADKVNKKKDQDYKVDELKRLKVAISNIIFLSFI